VSTVVVYRQDRRRRVTLVLLVLTSLVLISLDERGSGVISSTRSAAQDVVSPVQRLADDVINPAADWLDGLGRASELQDENTRLRGELAQARSQGAAGAIAQARLKEYSQILDLPDVADAFGVSADVLTQNVGNFSRQFTIDRGTDSGIARDMPVVVGGAALVGRVFSVSKSSAVIQRIDDRNFGAGARLVQAAALGPTGAASGQGDSSLLRFSVVGQAATTVALNRGDLVVTLGALGEPYPKDLPIGTIVHSVAAGGSIAQDAELRPIVDLDALDVVKVLKYTPVNLP
jgi:rod shape-determining protein MreC